MCVLHFLLRIRRSLRQSSAEISTFFLWQRLTKLHHGCPYLAGMAKYQEVTAKVWLAHMMKNKHSLIVVSERKGQRSMCNDNSSYSEENGVETSVWFKLNLCSHTSEGGYWNTQTSCCRNTSLVTPRWWGRCHALKHDNYGPQVPFP